MLMRNIIQIILSTFFLIGCSNFDSKKWKVNNDLDKPDNPRWNMVADLQSNYLKNNITTENQILNLLGKPSYTESNSLYYIIGWKSGFGIDPDYFVLQIDSNKKLIKSWKEQH
jgi:outer membrane protein assembly factor BamE (lipoprotein component of BamABCDE complex)